MMTLETNKKGFQYPKNLKHRLKKLFLPKDKMKKDEHVEELVVDALPDNCKENGNGHDIPGENELNKPGEYFNDLDEEKDDNTQSKEEESDDEIKSKREEDDKEKEKFSSWQSKNKESTQETSVTNNMNVYNSSVQIGNTYNYVQNQVINLVKSGNQKEEKSFDKKIEKSKEVEELFTKKTKVGQNHIEYLSDHFGMSWKLIGLKLGLTSGEMDIIAEYESDIKKMSRKVLERWVKQNGDKGTIGRLTERLWKSKIVSAREAVCKLAANWRKFD